MKFAKSLWHLSCGVILISTLLQNCVQSSFVGIVDIPASFYPGTADKRTHCGIRQEYPCLGAIKGFSSQSEYTDCVFMAELLIPADLLGDDSIKHRFFVKFVDHQDTRLQNHEFLVEKLAINTVPCGVNCLRFNGDTCSTGNCISHEEITFEFSFLLPVSPSCRNIVVNSGLPTKFIAGCGVDPTTSPCPLYFKHFPNFLDYIDSAGKKDCYKVRFRINVCSPLSSCLTAEMKQFDYIELYVYLVNISEWSSTPDLDFSLGLERETLNELLLRQGLILCVDPVSQSVKYFEKTSGTCDNATGQPALEEGFTFRLDEALKHDFDMRIADCEFV